MKKEILMLIIGILIGAIITTGVFLVLKENTGDQSMRMERGDRMEMDENAIGGGMQGERPGDINSVPDDIDETNTSESDI